MTFLSRSLGAFSLFVLSSTSFAGQLAVFNGWNVLANDDGYQANGYVNPGYGGQAFDAEYLFYKLQGTQLSIGLQTGFDIINSTGQLFDGHPYYTGDLALSFDGNTSNYEYAVDFGNLSKGYNTGKTISSQGVNVGTGIDTAGLYHVSSWNNDIYFGQSAPYAMSGGSLVLAANPGNFQEGFGFTGSDKSFYNIFTLDLSNISGLSSNFTLDAHWTMSCGNDALDGRVGLVKVPEPSPFILLAFGIAGLVLTRRKA